MCTTFFISEHVHAPYMYSTEIVIYIYICWRGELSTELENMEHSHKEAIRKNWTYLLENLMVDDLLDYLISHSIITENMKEEVEIQRTRREKATQLLFIVQKRGPKAFQTLIDGLKECHMEFIAERLESSVWSSFCIPIMLLWHKLWKDMCRSCVWYINYLYPRYIPW